MLPLYKDNSIILYDKYPSTLKKDEIILLNVSDRFLPYDIIIKQIDHFQVFRNGKPEIVYSISEEELNDNDTTINIWVKSLNTKIETLDSTTLGYFNKSKLQGKEIS